MYKTKLKYNSSPFIKNVMRVGYSLLNFYFGNLIGNQVTMWYSSLFMDDW